MINSIPSTDPTDQRKASSDARKMQRGDHEPRDQLFSESRVGAPFAVLADSGSLAVIRAKQAAFSFVESVGLVFWCDCLDWNASRSRGGTDREGSFESWRECRGKNSWRVYPVGLTNPRDWALL